jgi:putative nucleotidyltransferase with HDIG domain
MRSLRPHEVKLFARIRSFLRTRRMRGYLVGGFLRDILLGRDTGDIDIVLRGTAERSGKRAGTRPGERTGPVDLAAYLHKDLGYSKPAVFPRFKTALTVSQDLKVEICDLNQDLRTDAAGRDFTVNCLYADVAELTGRMKRSMIKDPTGLGIGDLRAGVLRTPGDPCETMWLDPLRALRAVRFHATLGLRLDAALTESLPRVAYLLGRVSAERIRMELETIVTSRRITGAFDLMARTGILDITIPELGRTRGYSQSTPYHAYDLYTHTLKTVASTPPDLTLRLAALLHDLGKPDTRTLKTGRAVYYGHDDESARIAETVLRRLRFPRRVVSDVTFLVRHHMINYSSGWSDRAVRRLIRKMGRHLEPILTLVEADRKAQRPDPRLPESIRELRRRIRKLEAANLVEVGLPVSGHDIMAALGVKEGPIVGKAKAFLQEEALKRKRLMSRKQCVRLLKDWQSRQG